MIKSALKAFSLSFLAVSAAAVSATEQVPSAHPAVRAMESASAGRFSSAEIARGWEAQQRLLDARLAARGTQRVEIPGTILSPPLPDFDLNRADGATATSRSARKGARPAHRSAPASW